MKQRKKFLIVFATLLILVMGTTAFASTSFKAWSVTLPHKRANVTAKKGTKTTNLKYGYVQVESCGSTGIKTWFYSYREADDIGEQKTIYASSSIPVKVYHNYTKKIYYDEDTKVKLRMENLEKTKFFKDSATGSVCFN